MAAATYPTNFSDWNAVASYYGQDVANALQQQNVPLNQVGQYIQNVAPTVFQGGSAAGPGYTSGGSDPGGGFQGQNLFGVAPGVAGSNLAQVISGSGGGQQQQGPSFDPTKNPNYPTSLLGAQALAAVGLNPSNTVTINPSPSNTPSSSQFAKSGVSAVASPMTASIAGIPMPKTTVGSVFNPASGTPYRPSRDNDINPTPQPTAANPGAGTSPFATVPPVAPVASNMMPPPAPTGFPGGIPPAAANYTAGVPGRGPISGLSPMATPPGPPSLPPGYGAEVKHMETGGQVREGDTDTVPAMLTPGEYVINRNAAQEIGRGRLDRLNSEGASPMHMQGGGPIPGSPSADYSMGVGAQNPTQSSDAQSYAFNQLSPQEQVALQGGGAAGQRVQLKYNQLASNYQGSSGSPTPMWAQAGGVRPMPMAQVHPQAPAAPAGQPQQQAAYSGSLDQWLGQYGHTPQGQAYIAQNGNVSEVQRYLQNLTTPQMTPGSPSYGYAPRASLMASPAGYGPAPRAELVGLPAGQGQAYDPSTYGVNTGAGAAGGAAGIVGNIAGAIGNIAQAFTKGVSQPYKWIQSAIPNPSDFKSQTPDIVLQGHQVGKPNTPGGYVLMAQPHDQGGDNTGYPQSPYGANLT